MTIRDRIIAIIKQAKPLPVQVTAASNLYTDLHFDSLEFVQLLLKIEQTFSIAIDLLEMEKCLRVDRLAALVENKSRDAENDTPLT